MVDMPTNRNEFTQLLNKLPLNAEIIFFHETGVYQNMYAGGIPPFCKLKKEKNNALNKIVYVGTDNRRGEQIFSEDDLPYKASDIFSKRIGKTDILFNIAQSDACAIKAGVGVSLPNLARPIARRDTREF